RSLATMSSAGEAFVDGRYIQGWAPGRNVNASLKWEKGKNWNIGLDFALFNNVLSGSFNYFNRTQQDLLGDYNVPMPPNIADQTYANVGTMRNQGVELDLNIDIVRGRNFSYTVGLIGYTTNNRFVSFSNDLYTGQKFYWMDGFPAPGSPGSVQRIDEGKRIGTFYTYEYAGVDDIGNWMVYNKDGAAIPINEGTDEDKRPVGNGLPLFTMSWNNSLRYKNLDLTLFFRGNFGYQVYNIHEFYWGLQSAAPNLNVLQAAYGKNAHIVKGMNAHNSYFVQDADYLKLDVATIGYNWDINSKWIEGLRLYFTGRNLLVLSKYDGVDPDIFPVNGLQPGIPSDKKGYYPSTRQFLLGIQINF
ncbi:MAG: TonB-dependent receptor, partial [Tannerella sp.]|nr:TonB-dependent receptor [Tannerella sp.]